ncbi:DUF4280 domain-containing protein [Flavobacterium hercynium]|uniref:DUF4280 domain-containing protein n=1 Tax=Flavobacterium hercynium TaxID=387094 RepID=A0A226GPC3_9FLAO|nr:DUF4280 domain-containing protein [Flavobacterium hercynium]OXA83899.1 hypothetical protein B0A66_21755 [Flavobacterium hercynium]PAM93838.1 DUF4280 domain-containing protein [Flavobacterium sp. IR1]SMP37327.1 protein of unknown function [Flavobacterium hercynium]
MSKKHIVVHGATLKCQFSEDPQATDTLKVKSQSKHYANDKDSDKKLIATTKEIGQTLEKNTFGNCKMQPLGNSFKPCQAMIQQWTGFYEKVTLSNQGKMLIENSKATCPIGGPDCIEITKHGQIAELSQQQFDNEDRELMQQICPLSLNKLQDENTFCS